MKFFEVYLRKHSFVQKKPGNRKPGEDAAALCHPAVVMEDGSQAQPLPPAARRK